MYTHKTACSLSIILLLLLSTLQVKSQRFTPKETDQKLLQAFHRIRHNYVDTANEAHLVEEAIISMLKELDPHSVYMNKEEIKRANEPLIGNFEGIGVQFQILRDTIVIVMPLFDGPSDKLGILPGDKIVLIEGENATGKKATTKYVRSKLLGKKGTQVTISVARKGEKELIDYTVTRDKIPIYSIDSYFMATSEIGYIKIDRFARTTMKEFNEAIATLQKDGLKHLIVDLRNNSGGYLHTAIDLSDEFLEKQKLIVFTEGQNSPKREYKSTADNLFTKGRVIVLINERSASASEIFAGAIQDWDRGLVIGRRSFGKGLVQKPFILPDGAVIRLTTARYYTPTGRCIQKSYDDGIEQYHKDIAGRYKHGEFINPDSIHFPDSLKYYTKNKRVVYGGGGIMPDIFVPLDTTRISDYYSKLLRKSITNNYALDYTNKNRELLMTKYPTLSDFITNFSFDKDKERKFREYAIKSGVSHKTIVQKKEKEILKKETHNYIDSLINKLDSSDVHSLDFHFDEKLLTNYINKTETIDNNQEDASQKFINNQIKALIARNLWQKNAYAKTFSKYDDTFLKALEVIENEKLFKKMKLQHK